MANILLVACDTGLYGAERVLLAVADKLSRSAKVLIAAPAEGPLVEALSANPLVEVVIVPLPVIAKKPSAILNYVLRTPPALLRLLMIIRAHSIDVVYANTLRNFISPLAARLARVCCIWHMHEKNWSGPAGRAAARVASLCADSVIFNSLFVRDSFTRFFPRLAAKSRLIYNGVDVENLNRLAQADDGAGRRLGAGGGSGWPLVGFFGRLVEQKRPLEFVEMAGRVARSVPDCRFVMVGGGRLKTRILKRAASLGIDGKLDVLDFATNPYPLMKACAVVVVPSVDEGYSLVTAEAMALERPTVCARSGALPELVDESSTGFLYPSGDTSALAERVIHLLRNPDLGRTLGEAGGSRIRALFSLERQLREIAKNVKNILCEVSSGKPSRVSP